MLHIGQHQPLWTLRILLVYNTSAAWTSWSKDEDLSGTQPHVLHAYSQRHALSGLTWQNDAILQPTDCASQGLYHCSSICRQSDNRTEGPNTHKPPNRRVAHHLNKNARNKPSPPDFQGDASAWYLYSAPQTIRVQAARPSSSPKV